MQHLRTRNGSQLAAQITRAEEREAAVAADAASALTRGGAEATLLGRFLSLVFDDLCRTDLLDLESIKTLRLINRETRLIIDRAAPLKGFKVTSKALPELLECHGVAARIKSLTLVDRLDRSSAVNLTVRDLPQLRHLELQNNQHAEELILLQGMTRWTALTSLDLLSPSGKKAFLSGLAGACGMRLQSLRIINARNLHAGALAAAFNGLSTLRVLKLIDIWLDHETTLFAQDCLPHLEELHISTIRTCYRAQGSITSKANFPSLRKLVYSDTYDNILSFRTEDAPWLRTLRFWTRELYCPPKYLWPVCPTAPLKCSN